MSSPDFKIEFHGTLTLLRPLTDACREWIDENVETEDWQWFGQPGAAWGCALAVVVHPGIRGIMRYLETLVEGLNEAGLTGTFL